MTSENNGKIVVVKSANGEQTWTCTNPEQAEKMLPTFQARSDKLSIGDVSAINDAANEYRKQRDS